jgi:NitT/TauT family transport system ATP-binding protein
VTDSPAKLSIRSVTKRFETSRNEILALADFSLDVREGEFLVLVGPSGCGKSTLLNMIAGLDRPDEGVILLDGTPIDGPSPERGVVFQDGALFPWLTVRGNVEFGLEQLGVGGRERTERAEELLQKVGLWGFQDNAIHELSGGMRQRCAIARCMALQPKIILMDEPFSALDAMTREDLYDELQVLYSGGSTVVFVTHNVREAVTLGDRVVVMSARPAKIQAQLEVDILRPRHIDDVDVAVLAQQISGILKHGVLHAEHAGVAS